MRRIIAATLAGVALAATIPVLGGARDHVPVPADPEYRVPAGMVEHTVTELNVRGGGRTRSDVWLTADRGRKLVTDAASGRVIAETTAADGVLRVYEREFDRVTVERARGLPFTSAAYEAAAQRAALESGRVRTIGERTVRGRRALVTRSDGGTVTVVDAETSEVLERRTALQTEVRTTELLPAGSPRARLAMRPHPGADVVRTG